MKVLFVDDEPLALRAIKRQLKLIDEDNIIDIVGVCTEAEKSIQKAVELQPDVVFLDISMPGMDGLTLSERIIAELKEVEVVFVTAYDEYAIRAFELNAIDYLLKPVQSKRLKITISRLFNSLKRKHSVLQTTKSVMIHCFQQLQIETDHRHVINWRTNKAQELFAYLIHNHNKPIHKDVLLELLWPETDLKRGMTQLYTTLHQIRKTLLSLDIEGTIKNHNSYYRLVIKNIQIDIKVWQEKLRQAPPLTIATIKHHRVIFDMYTGDYFSDHGYVWVEEDKERLRRKWHCHALKLAEFLDKSDMIEEALHVYHRILNSSPFLEEIHWLIMKIYLRLGDRYAVVSQYKKLTDILKEELNTAPMQEIIRWYDTHITEQGV